MVERVIFYLEEEWYKRCLAEAAEAVQSFKQYGFDADLWVIEAGEEIPEPDHNTLYLADSKRLLQMLAWPTAERFTAPILTKQIKGRS